MNVEEHVNLFKKRYATQPIAIKTPSKKKSKEPNPEVNEVQDSKVNVLPISKKSSNAIEEEYSSYESDSDTEPTNNNRIQLPSRKQPSRIRSDLMRILRL